MKILVTGGGGQLASELVHFPINAPLSVRAFSRIDLDIVDRHSVENVLQQQRPDWVVNTAAYTAVDAAEADESQAFAVNCQGVENLAIVCRELNIPLLHISTDYVFDGQQQQPYDENQVTDPLNVYGKSKLAGEKVLVDIWDKHIILRTAWVYGNYGHNFMKTMCRLAKEKNELSIVADQYGSPTATYDIAQAIFTIVQLPEITWGTYHFVNQGSTSWFDFAKAIIELDSQQQHYPMPLLKAITTDEYPTAAKRPKYSLLDCTKVQKTFNIHSRPWQQALQTTMELR